MSYWLIFGIYRYIVDKWKEKLMNSFLINTFSIYFKDVSYHYGKEKLIDKSKGSGRRISGHILREENQSAKTSTKTTNQ